MFYLTKYWHTSNVVLVCHGGGGGDSALPACVSECVPYTVTNDATQAHK